jgi:hypothetical protein
MRLIDNWPKLLLLVVPSAVVILTGSLLLYEHFQSDTEKATRLVKESGSRKERFTVQQYLYSTIYNRKDEGEQITISGWTAAPSSEGEMRVLFTWSDSEGEHVAEWSANLDRSTVAPRNETARYLSWHR